MKEKLLIGITGGLGAGKSVAGKYIESKGYPVILSDALAKDLMKNDPSVKKKLVRLFGDDIYIKGELNTGLLAEKIFNSSELLSKVNSIVHPPTIEATLNLAEKYFKKHDIVFVESAILYEAGMEDLFDFVILIYSHEKLRIERAMKRGLSKEDALRRMENQMKDELKKKRADFVIENNSTIEELHKKLDFVLNLISMTQS
ncbi:putative dephospho-CoA kinase [Melioribacter roseus P3M-2]|uniref:Dephospho-CoA kinase n=1 Tax=Melioribacter roseus (strain DSM 23840 / JCM 17771 / VKM B-2668 / P3M-2) TaxID=1191523 RepID=I6ZZZ5_MELRP|nr:dephospho-CoA kinase [Melioribacter roseus]AFN73306.1 putative dephospho-CoA kinase [Melioribacter roseus P3M-2]